jgi:alkylhydroperoxidase family enzyme
MARLRKVERDDIPEDLHYVWDRLGGEGGQPPNIFRVMSNNPELMLNYVRFGNSLWRLCGLDPATRELVILRTAFLKQSTYEWHQHVRIGREAGLSDERILGLRDWQEGDLYNEPECWLLSWVDALHESDHPPQDLYEGLARHFPPPAIVGVTLLTSFYGMTAKFLASMEMETEAPFVGWDLKGGK